MSISQPTTSINNLLDLPNEVLINILEYLPIPNIVAVRHTCSRLYRITQFKVMLKNRKYVFKFTDLNENEMILNKIIELNLCDLDLELNLSNLKSISKEVELMMSKIIRLLGPKISFLNLRCRYKDLPFPIIEDVLFTCINLKELGIHEFLVEWSGKSPTKPDNTNLKLEILRINECSFTSDIVINIFLDFYPAIIVLEYHPNLYIHEVMLEGEQADEFVLNKILTYNNSIQELYLSTVSDYGFTNAQIMKLATSELKLRVINLTRMCDLLKTEFQALFSKHHNLKKLRLSCMEEFYVECLQYLFTHCPELEYLSLHSTSLLYKLPDDLHIMTQIGTKLKFLELENIELYGGNSKNLKLLNLEEVRLYRCSREIDGNCFQFLENCRLKYLILDECCIEEEDLIRIISASQDTLITLNVSASSTTPANLSSVRFSKLQDLRIRGSKSLTSAIVQNFNFPYLKKLNFYSYVVKVQEIKMIMSGCPFLEDLCFWIDNEVNDQILVDLRNNMNFLKKFKYKDCKGEYARITTYERWNNNIFLHFSDSL